MRGNDDDLRFSSNLIITSPVFFFKHKSNRCSGSCLFSFDSISNVKDVYKFETQLFRIERRHGADVSFFPHKSKGFIGLLLIMVTISLDLYSCFCNRERMKHYRWPGPDIDGLLPGKHIWLTLIRSRSRFHLLISAAKMKERLFEFFKASRFI